MEQLNNRDYYVARAAAARRLARDASDPHIAKIHADFAHKYAAAADHIDITTLRVVRD